MWAAHFRIMEGGKSSCLKLFLFFRLWVILCTSHSLTGVKYREFIGRSKTDLPCACLAVFAAYGEVFDENDWFRFYYLFIVRNEDFCMYVCSIYSYSLLILTLPTLLTNFCLYSVVSFLVLCIYMYFLLTYTYQTF